MLTLPQLTDLERGLRDARVLSVYLAGQSRDPAARDEWRRWLDDSLREGRVAIAEEWPDQVVEFDVDVTALRTRLEVGDAPGRLGWVAFVAHGIVLHAGPLPAPMPAWVGWDLGIHAAPYLRALKQLRPAYVALVNSERVRILRYLDGSLEALEVVGAAHRGREPAHMGDAPAPGFHQGTRGTTATDENERHRVDAMHRMATAAADRLRELAGDEGWILLGGTPAARGLVCAALPERLVPRTLVVPELHDGASDAALLRAVESGVSEIRDARDLALIEEVLAGRDANRASAVGADATRQALEMHAVRELLLSHEFVRAHGDEADAAVRAALDQGAAVEEVSGPAAERLDGEAGGIAAQLRFGMPTGATPREDVS